MIVIWYYRLLDAKQWWGKKNLTLYIGLKMEHFGMECQKEDFHSLFFIFYFSFYFQGSKSFSYMIFSSFFFSDTYSAVLIVYSLCQWKILKSV